MNKLFQDVVGHFNEIKRDDVALLALQGSWNYGLGYEDSDVDTKALIIPKFEDFVLLKQPLSTTHILENGEHCDLKDIRLYFGEFWKQNINFLEVLFTSYYITSSSFHPYFMELLKMRERIARYDVYKTIRSHVGQCTQRLKILQMELDENVPCQKKIGKMLCEILRLEEFLVRYLSNEDFYDCITKHNLYSKDFLIDLKRGRTEGVDVNSMAKDAVHHMISLKIKYEEKYDNKFFVDKEIREKVEKLLCDFLTESFKKEVL